MQYKRVDERQWVVVLKRGERIMEKLTDFINREGIQAGYFNAIGAVSAVELGHYNLGKGEYTTKQIDSPLEIVSLMGNVSTKGEEKIIHGHIVVGTDEMQLFGGHLKEATVAATCEIMFKEFQEKVKREYDGDIKLHLLAPEG